MVVDGLGKTGPEFSGMSLAGMLFVRGLQFAAEDVVTFFAAGEAHDLELGWEIASSGDVVQSRDEFAVGKIACGTEYDNRAGFGAGLLNEGFLEGVFHEVFILFGDYGLEVAQDNVFAWRSKESHCAEDEVNSSFK
jgi:hypothetical protein